MVFSALGPGGSPHVGVRCLDRPSGPWSRIAPADIPSRSSRRIPRATWDVIGWGFGPDVAFLDAALAKLFESVVIDTGRIATAGSSDGASYAISLGLTNVALFSDIIAFSPGFAAPSRAKDAPACPIGWSGVSLSA